MQKFTFIFIVLLTICLSSCRKDNDNDPTNGYLNVELDDFIIENFSNDAKLLYYHEVYNNPNHPDHNEILLDTAQITEVLKIIQLVYNLDCPERDSVFNYYQIHARLCYSFNEIQLEVDPYLIEIDNLANGIIPTGDEDLDALLSAYEFDSVYTFYSYPNFPWLSIRTNKEFNLIPIAKKFKELPQVTESEFSTLCIGDGNTITLDRQGNSATIIFSIGSGDCPAGCLFHKYWEFRVENGKAAFVRTYTN